jgi:hypothetical protein
VVHSSTLEKDTLILRQCWSSILYIGVSLPPQAALLPSLSRQALLLSAGGIHCGRRRSGSVAGDDQRHSVSKDRVWGVRFTAACQLPTKSLASFGDCTGLPAVKNVQFLSTCTPTMQVHGEIPTKRPCHRRCRSESRWRRYGNTSAAARTLSFGKWCVCVCEFSLAGANPNRSLARRWLHVMPANPPSGALCPRHSTLCSARISCPLVQPPPPLFSLSNAVSG